MPYFTVTSVLNHRQPRLLFDKVKYSFAGWKLHSFFSLTMLHLNNGRVYI